jgi:hypothetical protein
MPASEYWLWTATLREAMRQVDAGTPEQMRGIAPSPPDDND